MKEKENTIKYPGLSEREVEISREKNGSNVIVTKKKDSILTKALDTFKEPMFILLIIAASIYFIVGEYIDGLIMLLFVLVICVIEFFQKQKTDKALEELNKLAALNVKVIRNKELKVVDSKEIVVGDVVLLEEGDKVPADGIIINGIIILILPLFIYLPFSHNTFNTCALGIKEWIIVIVIALLSVIPFDILKIINRDKLK